MCLFGFSFGCYFAGVWWLDCLCCVAFWFVFVFMVLVVLIYSVSLKVLRLFVGWEAFVVGWEVFVVW